MLMLMRGLLTLALRGGAGTSGARAGAGERTGAGGGTRGDELDERTAVTSPARRAGTKSIGPFKKGRRVHRF